MKQNLLLLAVMIGVMLIFTPHHAGAQCPQDTIDHGICDTLYLEVWPADTIFSPPGPHFTPVSFYTWHDVPDPVIDSIPGFVLPLCFTHSNPAKYCSLSAYCNQVAFSGPAASHSIFRHLPDMTNPQVHNWMMDLYEQGNGGEWNNISLNLDGTSHFWLMMTSSGTEDQRFGPGQRVLLSTMTFKLEDTMTVCIDTCFWPPSARLAFARADAKLYIPRIWDDYLGEEEYCFKVTGGGAQCVPPPSGMDAWWSLDETSGTSSNDLAGSVNNFGTWMNSPAPVTGKVAGALSFSGSNSVDVPDHAELNVGTGDFSIDLWIKTADASGTRTILDKRTGSVSNPTGYTVYMNNGNLGSQIGDGVGYNSWTTNGFIADGNWHHIAVTVDRDNPTGWLHYVDGSRVGTPGGPTAYWRSLTNTAPFVMARNLLTPGYTFTGTLDEVELFKRVLDSLEIYSIWHADTLGKCKTVCYADGDANNDALVLTSADMFYLAEFISACGPAPVPLYSCDLNGDGYVDLADVLLYQDFFVYGISVFDPYGGYPVLCPCNPDPAPVPDTVTIFRIEHVSGGTACFDTAGGVLTVSRIWPEPCDTLVDVNGDTIIIVAPPDKAESGGGPYSSSKSNLEDAGIAWSGDYKEDSTLEAGATLEVEAYGIVNGDSGQLAASSVQTKQGDDSWALGVKAAVNSYNVKAYLHGQLVWSQSDITASGEWFQVGRLGKNAKAESGGGPYSSSKSNLEDAGIIVIERESEDTLTWNWESQGVSGLEIDALRIEGKINAQTDVGYFTSVVQYAMNIPSFTITSESQAIAYGDIHITALGNAIATLVETTLVVSNIGPGCYDGIDAEKNDNDGEWSIVVANPDTSGTLPVGASLETEFFFATPTQPDSFSMAISMAKAALNTWDLAVQSEASICSVKAFNNGSPVFAGVDVGTTDLGYIVESAKGVYPVGFKGGASSKPAGVAVSSDYDFTASPNGVQWTWAAHGVSNLQIDYLSTSAEVFDTSLFGVTHTTMCGDNGAKTDPISFTILDIEVTPPYILGDVNADLIINVGDIVYLVSYLYRGGPEPKPKESGDVNCDGIVNVGDIVYLVSYLYRGGPPPTC